VCVCVVKTKLSLAQVSLCLRWFWMLQYYDSTGSLCPAPSGNVPGLPVGRRQGSLSIAGRRGRKWKMAYRRAVNTNTVSHASSALRLVSGAQLVSKGLDIEEIKPGVKKVILQSHKLRSIFQTDSFMLQFIHLMHKSSLFLD